MQLVMIQLEGDVQGLGIRPSVARLATRLGVNGSVCNCQYGVEIIASAPRAALLEFQRALRLAAPGARLSWSSQAWREVPDGFCIGDSQTAGQAQFVVPLDRVTCVECLNESFSPGNRRFGYGLNSCASCGPRYSIIRAMPYDRQRTSLVDFPMCDACRVEYEDATHRRYHAQSNCCPVCGPKLWFEADGQSCTEDVVPLAANALRQGQILALKGIGGYQLLCDATNQRSVVSLRLRKGRLYKPLAVMVASLVAAGRLAHLDSLEQAALQSAVGPIVLVECRTATPLASSVHPGLKQIGLMLPSTALHALLLAEVERPLVVTSGNREGEPLEYLEQTAGEQLRDIADCFIHHNRSIVAPVDDSVVRCMAGRQVTLRAARGAAPLQLHLQASGDGKNQFLATGGQYKAAVAVSSSRIAVLGPYVGDLDTLRQRQRYMQHQQALQSLLHIRPNIISHDQHPDYFTTRFASDQPAPRLLAVQHHHAHIAAAMVEQDWLDQQVLGFAFDGTGWGSDGKIWGGEVLLANARDFQRVAHLRAFRLLGGDVAVRQPWRIGLALLQDACRSRQEFEDLRSLLNTRWGLDRSLLESFLALLETSSHGWETTSMGRLFDAASSIACGQARNSYEGEAAMRLEGACTRGIDRGYSVVLRGTAPIEMDWRPMLREMASDALSGIGAGTMAMKFHLAIAEWVVQIAGKFPHLPIVLTGGVFQNRVLVELLQVLLTNHPAPIAFPGRIPVNDGGLAVGQLAIVAAREGRQVVCV